ncbi:MAG: MiaB/RimO family radical SAM methylthiotransferase [Nanoarchaeota archaeon]|jgi:threonylcarbamoyladenosine tRNA methylthiotransferase CDKAL1|nr:MiaB/RimO family radical SAM methylthiotransferase [Nanoarchaeota archaeon]
MQPSYKKNSFFILPQGCPCNIADAKKIASFLESQGHKITKEQESAENIIIVTCGFNEEKLKHSLEEIKEIGKIGKKIYLAGCLPKIRPEEIKQFEIIATPKNFSKLNKFKNKISTKSIDDFSPEFSDKTIKYIRISTGCSGKCSYCAIKQATGYVKSRSIQTIKKDFKEAIKKHKQIALIGEDIGSWGLDIGLKLNNLLEELIKIKGNYKILLSSINPKNIINNNMLINLFSHKNIGETIYLPNQSSSNKLLKKMNRGYTIEQYSSVYKKLKKIKPNLKLQTDILVGFPGETEEDHKKNINFIKNYDINFLQVFMYTKMKRTLSEGLKDIDKKIKIKRTKELIKIFLEKNKNENRLLVNTNIELETFKDTSTNHPKIQ